MKFDLGGGRAIAPFRRHIFTIITYCPLHTFSDLPPALTGFIPVMQDLVPSTVQCSVWHLTRYGRWLRCFEFNLNSQEKKKQWTEPTTTRLTLVAPIASIDSIAIAPHLMSDLIHPHLLTLPEGDLHKTNLSIFQQFQKVSHNFNAKALLYHLVVSIMSLTCFLTKIRPKWRPGRPFSLETKRK